MTQIALLTDFGHRDHYVGLMRSIIAHRAPSTPIIDLCHEAPAQDLASGAYLLYSAAPYLPTGSIIVAVIDPGVGTSRRPIAVQSQGYTFILPDNGLLSLWLSKHPAQAAVLLDNPAHQRHPISATFHGRDIFAPAAGALAAGFTLSQLGSAISTSSLIIDPALTLATPTPARQLIAGILHIDHFGNLITNAHIEQLDALGPAQQLNIWLNELRIPLKQTFGQVSPGQPVAYIGSFGHLEIAIRDGDAARAFGVDKRATLTITST